MIEHWYAGPFRTHTLADRLPNSFDVLFSLGYNHVLAASSILHLAVRLLQLLATGWSGNAEED